MKKYINNFIIGGGVILSNIVSHYFLNQISYKPNQLYNSLDLRYYLPR